MKVRKLAVALALAGGLGSGMANALGLGEIELQSWLNEPLDAEISLRQSQGVNPADVYVNVAPEAAYERVGLDRNQFLSKLRFNVVTAPDGGLRIDVSSREPLREPYLNFLLELTWPSGRLMREYAVLVDPPVYAEESGLDESVSAPESGASEPEPQRSAESLRRQAEIEGSVSRTYQSADTFGPTGPSDTLWSIARQMRPDNSVSMHQMMLAIQEENPDAFMDGNINQLMQGQVLRVPSREQIQGRSRAEADREVARQNEAFRTPAPAKDATAQAQPAEADGDASSQAPSGSDDDSELKLLVADDTASEERAAEEGGSAGGDGDLAGGQDAGAAMAAEEMDALRRENQELDSRLQDLQDQVQTLQRLLELKDNQLAGLQGMADEQAESAAPADSAGQADEQATDAAAPADSAQSPDEGAAPEEPATAAEQPVPASDQPLASADDASPEQAEVDAQEGQQETAGGGTEANSESVASESAAEPEPAVEPEPVQPPVPSAQKSFPGNVIDAIMTNPLYQIALGGGLVLLLLLALLARRRQAAKEKEFFDQFAEEELPEQDGSDTDASADTSAEEPASGANGGEETDPMEEADKYLGFGQYPQAAQVLESAISREPSRSDLRLKLLSVYADSQDAESFEKQYNELASLEDENATARADELRNRMQEDEAGPSIDDLESQLRSEGHDDATASTSFEEAEEFEARTDLESDIAEQTDASEETMEFDLSLADLEGEDEATGLEFEETPVESERNESEDEEPDFSSLEFEQSPELELEESPELQDLTSEFEETESEKPQAEETDTLEDELSVGPQSLDDSFLDDLDAELDKVSADDQSTSEAGDSLELAPEQDEKAEPEATAESEEDDFSLDMDLSEEDLAIMDELSDEGDIPSLDEEVSETETGAEPESEPSGEPELPEQSAGEPEEPDEQSQSEPELPSESGTDTSASALDLDESDLGDDDDFDFLAGTDEAATKLDLARAYVEMGDSDGARDILEEVALEGNDEQKAEAQELLKNLS